MNATSTEHALVRAGGSAARGLVGDDVRARPAHAGRGLVGDPRGARAGADATLSWNASAEARFYLRMTTGIGTHGGISPVEVECEGPDTGVLTLPGEFLDALYAEGWSCGECGDNRLARYRAAERSAGDIDVQLRVETRVFFFYRP